MFGGGGGLVLFALVYSFPVISCKVCSIGRGSIVVSLASSKNLPIRVREFRELCCCCSCCDSSCWSLSLGVYLFTRRHFESWFSDVHGCR